MNEIPEVFLIKASEVLADKEKGLSGSKIVKYFLDFAVDFNINIPYSTYPFPKTLPNKRAAFKENLKVFTSEQQFKIIAYMSDLDIFKNNEEVKKLKMQLFERYSNLNVDKIKTEIDTTKVKHWLSIYPDSLKSYNEAVKQFELNIFQRNLLDNLRLSLELFLKAVLNNKKSLENQQRDLGQYIKKNNCSKEINNMFLKLIKYYSQYQNEYIKHNDKVNENEVEIIFDLTSLFMKFLIKIGK